MPLVPTWTHSSFSSLSLAFVAFIAFMDCLGLACIAVIAFMAFLGLAFIAFWTSALALRTPAFQRLVAFIAFIAFIAMAMARGDDLQLELGPKLLRMCFEISRCYFVV